MERLFGAVRSVGSLALSTMGGTGARVLTDFVDHYNGHRPNRALGLAPPEPRQLELPVPTPSIAAIRRHDRLGGLIHEYTIAA